MRSRCERMPLTMLAPLLLTLCAFAGSAAGQRRGGGGGRVAVGAGAAGAGAGQPVDFDCPEEFGYHPHPSDCSQYYVCVFGGALLEACTGGLMYSHELQTCDWPRNVGCGGGAGDGGGGGGGGVSTVRVTDPRTRQTTPPAHRTSSQVARDQVQQRQQQEEIAKHQLYADDLGPAEEIESDRQQRVYRGQPSTVGQVARDRDGLRHQPVTNSIPASRGSSAEKVAVISFGNQQQAQNTQYSFDLLTENNLLTNETTHRRRKRQTRFRYPARIVQIVPSGGRTQWPPPPSHSVHGVSNGGSFKYQGNSNRSKPPRLLDPIAPDSNFQPALNPNVPPDIRHFHNPDQYGNPKTHPPPNTKFSNPDSSYGQRPSTNFEPDLNEGQSSDQRTPTYNSATSSKHPSGSSTPTHSVIIPSSYATFHNLPHVPTHYETQASSSLNSTPGRVPPTNPPYQSDDDDSYSYFHLDHQANLNSPSTPPIPFFSSSPTLSNLLTTLKNAEILVGQNPQNNAATENGQNGLQILKSLTSLHEVPYNSDGTRLYQIPHPHHHSVGLNSEYNPTQFIHPLVGQNNPSFPVLGNYHAATNVDHVTTKNNPERHADTTTQAPFTPNSNPYGIRYEHELKAQDVQQSYRQTTAPQQFPKYPEDSQSKKVNIPVTQAPRRPPYFQAPDRIPSNEYSSSEEEYYDESEEVNDHYSQVSPNYHKTTNTFKEHQNPFSDINFDFDKYLEKLRGGHKTTATAAGRQKQPLQSGPGKYRRPQEYNDYSDEEYEDYEESEEKSQENYKPLQSYNGSAKPSVAHSSNLQSSTESSNHKNITTVTTPKSRYKIPGKVSVTFPESNPTEQPRVPDTLTLPFFQGADGNFYSRQPVEQDESYNAKDSTSHPYSQLGSSQQSNSYRATSNVGEVGKTRRPYVENVEISTEYSSFREKERTPSYKGFQEHVYHPEVATTSRPLSTSLRSETNIKSQQEYSEDLEYAPRPVKNTAHKNRFNITRPLNEQTGSHLFPSQTYQQHESLKETTTTSNLDFTSSDEYNEHASSTTKIPYKTTKLPNSPYHDIVVKNIHTTVTPGYDPQIKIPTKTGSSHKGQLSQRNRQPLYNSSSSDVEGANIFSSVKDTISMMSSTSHTLETNVPVTPSYNKTKSFNYRHTTRPPQSSNPTTTLKTYTIRRRPPKITTTTPRYRTRKPTTSPDNNHLGSLALSTSRPQTVTSRPNRHPNVKSRLKSTTTERIAGPRDSDQNDSTDKPKATVIRHNKKLASDKEGSRTTNSLRVEPSPASVSYVQQPLLQASPSPAYNNTQQQYDTSQYDPYYSLYDEDVELYRDVDYTQFTSNQGQTQTNTQQQYRGQSPYKQAPQQPEVQAQKNSGFAQPTYNTQDVYVQSAGPQDYNENYNTQLTNDEIQYRQQGARLPTQAPSSGNGIEPNLSNETTRSTPNPITSTTSSTSDKITTTNIAPAVVLSRQQTRQRVESNRSGTQSTPRTSTSTTTSTTSTTSTTTTASTSNYDIPAEFDSLWNLPVQDNHSSPPPPSTTKVASTTQSENVARLSESPRGSQRSSSADPRPQSRRISLTASLSLDEPFATGRRGGSRSSNSRRNPYIAEESNSRSSGRQGTSEVLQVNSQPLRSSKTVQRNPNPPRRVASKSFVVADSPDSGHRNFGYLTEADIDPQPSRLDDSEIPSRTAARVVNKVPQSRGTQSKTESVSEELASLPQAEKLILESDIPRQSVNSAAPLKPTVNSISFSDSDSESNSLSSPTLSRNTIAQPEIASNRIRSRDGIQVKACSDEVDSNSNTDCSEKQHVRVRPTTAQPDSQTTPGPARVSTPARTRGNPAYTASISSDTVNRGTPASVRTRPTLKPSTAIVPKAQEFVDIYKYPPKRPDSIYPTPQVDKTAAKCRKDVCLLPDCYCGGKEIPGDLNAEELPQIVLLTFDDAVNDLNKGLYSDLFERGRTNANGCPISATFYVSHEWTDYSQVQNLYADGHEMASHSVSHSFGEQFSQKKWTKEIGGQREILAAYGGVKLEDVRGMRAPFLAIGGNKMFKMLYDSNFTYDSSMPVYENRPPSWPYTLDYKIFHDCMIPPCPTRSYPGVWEVPMVMWQDLNGGRCSMGDACSNPPTADGVYKMLIKNFERHYTTNRAPFGLFYHAAWFTQPHHKEGFEAFLDTIVNMPDVWLVTNWQAIQWMRDPTPLSRINSFQPWQCNYPDRPKKCNNPKVCNLWHKSGVRYMRTCQPCPDIYPWTGKTGVRNSKVDNEVIEE